MAHRHRSSNSLPCQDEASITAHACIRPMASSWLVVGTAAAAAALKVARGGEKMKSTPLLSPCRIAAPIVALLALSVASCGGSDDNTAQPVAAPAAVTVAYTNGVATTSNAVAYWNKIATDTINRRAGRYRHCLKSSAQHLPSISPRFTSPSMTQSTPLWAPTSPSPRRPRRRPQALRRKRPRLRQLTAC